MSEKQKAAFPFKVGALGKTASETCSKNTPWLSKRQQVKQIIVSLAVRGVIPVATAEWLLCKMGLTHV